MTATRTTASGTPYRVSRRVCACGRRYRARSYWSEKFRQWGSVRHCAACHGKRYEVHSSVRLPRKLDLPSWSCAECGRSGMGVTRSRRAWLCTACDRRRERDRRCRLGLVRRLLNTCGERFAEIAIARVMRDPVPGALPDVSAELVARALALVRAGATYGAAARAVGLQSDTVGRAARRAGISRRRGSQRAEARP